MAWRWPRRRLPAAAASWRSGGSPADSTPRWRRPATWCSRTPSTKAGVRGSTGARRPCGAPTWRSGRGSGAGRPAPGGAALLAAVAGHGAAGRAGHADGARVLALENLLRSAGRRSQATVDDQPRRLERRAEQAQGRVFARLPGGVGSRERVALEAHALFGQPAQAVRAGAPRKPFQLSRGTYQSIWFG